MLISFRAVLADVGVDVPGDAGRALAGFLAAPRNSASAASTSKGAAADHAAPEPSSRASTPASSRPRAGSPSRSDARLLHFQALHLGLALKAGELFRGSRSASPTTGRKLERRRADEGARRLGDCAGPSSRRGHRRARALGRATMARGSAAFFQGRFRDAVTDLDETKKIRQPAPAWRGSLTAAPLVAARAVLPRICRVRRRETSIASTLRRGAISSSRPGSARRAPPRSTSPTTSDKAAPIGNGPRSLDRPELETVSISSRRCGTGRWSSYVLGDGKLGPPSIASQWPAVEKALLLRVQVCGVLLHHARGAARRSRPARASSTDERSKLVAIAERDARGDRQARRRLRRPLAGILRAGVTALRRGRHRERVAPRRGRREAARRLRTHLDR